MRRRDFLKSTGAITGGIALVGELGEYLGWHTADDWDRSQVNRGTVHNNEGGFLDTQVAPGYDLTSPYRVSDLEVYLPLQEEDDSTAQDYSGNDNDAQLNGPSPTTAMLGNPGYELVRSEGDSIDGTKPAMSDVVTKTLWVKFDSIVGRQQLVGEADGDSATVWVENDGDGSGFTQKFFVDTGSEEYSITGAGRLVPDVWYLFVYTVDQTSSIARGYINGSPVKPRTTPTTTGDTFDLGTEYRIGGAPDESLYLDGVVKDYREYSAYFTQEDVLRLMREGVGADGTRVTTPDTLEKTDRFGKIHPEVTNPIIRASAVGWADDFREHGNVLYSSSHLSPPYIFYTGDESQVGCLRSSDGYSWTGGSFVAGQSQHRHQDPWVIPPWEHSVDSQTYYMFIEDDGGGSTWEIKRKEGPHPESIDSNLTTVVPLGSDWDDKLTGSPVTFSYNGDWYILYEGIPDSPDKYNGGAFGLTATSSLSNDSWTKLDNNPVLESTDLPWWGGDQTDNWGTIVPDDVHHHEGRWFVVGHATDNERTKHKFMVYTDTDPPYWDNDLWEWGTNPILFDHHYDTGNHAHSATTWRHPETGEMHIMANNYATSKIHQFRLYENSPAYMMTSREVIE